MAFQGIIPRVPSWKEEFARNLGQGLSQGIQGLAQGYGQHLQQKQLSNYFGRLKEEHPGEKTYELMSSIAASPLPMEQKAAFLKAMTSFGDPYRAQQQERLQLDSVLRRYNNLIGETDRSLESARRGTPERKQLEERRKYLSNERDRLLKLDTLSPIDLEKAEKALSTHPEAQEEEEDAFVEEFRPRVKFDPNNLKHRAVRDKVMKQVGGDRNKAGKILSKAFRL